MCRPSQFVYSCNHIMGQGTHYCIYRERIDNTSDDNTSDASLLTAEKELKLLDLCHRDARKGTENKQQGHLCGRCTYEALGGQS